MAVPKKRTSARRRDMRASHHALTPTHAILCPNCGEPVLRHRVCASCGQYRGRKVFEVAQAK